MASFLAVLLFSLVHLFAVRARELGFDRHAHLLSVGGGVSVAYVFIDLLPKIGKNELIVRQAGFFPYFEKHVYILALIGFLTFFIVEKVQKTEKGFWFSLSSYSLLNFLVGYAVADKDDPDVRPLLLFTFAMALHYFINDYALSQKHQLLYEKIGRYILIVFLFLGWLAGQWVELPATAVALVAAFIGGGVIMNVTRHELPKENPHNLAALLLSAGAYTLLLLFIGA